MPPKSYFYLSSHGDYESKLAYDGGRAIGFFVPLAFRKPHYIWWDTGTLLGGSSLGYRYVFHSTVVSQHWFLGFYLAYDRYGQFELDHQLTNIYRGNIGLELAGSKVGQLSVNAYGVTPFRQQQLASCSTLYFLQHENITIASFLDRVDTIGCSVKWLSIPNSYQHQLSVLLAYSGMQKTRIAKEFFASSKVLRLGLGCEFNCLSLSRVSLQWIIDSCQRSYLQVGFKLKGIRAHNSNDVFQGCLHRPAERHIPSYLSKSSALISSQEVETSSLPVYQRELPLGHTSLLKGDQSSLTD